MKVIVFILSFLIPLMGLSQFDVKTIDITANDIVYDGVTDKLYVSIPSSNGANGNSIGVVNPYTATLENTVFIGSEPTVLAISNDGQFIYTGFDGASKVVRFDLATQSIGADFDLGSHPNWGNLFVEDLEVAPNNPLNVVVARKSSNSNNHQGVAFFDNGVMRTTTTSSWDRCNKIAFYDSDSLLAYNNTSTSFDLFKLAITNVGVSIIESHPNIMSGFMTDFLYHDNTIYSSTGLVIKMNESFNLEGQFFGAFGPMVFDTLLNKVCFATSSFNNGITFQRFNRNTFILEDSFELPSSNGKAINHVSCGKGCYAFNTEDNKVVILRETGVVGVNSIADKTRLRIYPNPVIDILYWESEKVIQQATVFDSRGAMKFTRFNPSKSILIDALPAGIYYLQLTTETGQVLSESFVKR